MDEEKGVSYVVKGEIDLSDIEVDPEVPLRVAAVHDGKILASENVDIPKAKQAKVPYELRFSLPSPCGFHVLLGRAGVPDRVFLASELATRWISPKGAGNKKKATAAGSLTLAVQPLVVEAGRYRLWLGLCQRYRVRGRVVCRHRRWLGHYFRFCDEPVPGARVELYDVDCFWWFCRRDLITTVTTAPDGTFEAEFWWCCPPLRPWFPDLWALDPDLFDRIRRLLEKLRPRLPVPLPDPPPDPRELGSFLETLGGALQAQEINHLRSAMASAAVRPLSETEIAKRLPWDPELESIHVWPWWPYRDCSPDLVFRVTQECHGVVEIIHSESNWQTRWNMPNDLTVTLLANDKACCIPVCEDPPCGDCFKWAEVGCTAVRDIGGNDPATPVAPDLLGLAQPGVADIAFARGLSVTGVFGSLSDVHYYEIEYSRDGLPFAALPLAALAGFTRLFWGPPCGGGVAQWNSSSFPITTLEDTAGVDHHVYETREHFEQGCDLASWGITRFWTSNRDLALSWVTADQSAAGTETSLMPDGLYELRVVGYLLNGANKLVDRQIMKRCDSNKEERLVIRLDNRTLPNHPPFATDHPWGGGFVHIGSVDPDCDFVQLIRNEGKAGELAVGACDIVELTDTDSLTVRFSVTVPPADTDRHLGGYWMTVHHGESSIFDAIATSLGGPLPDPTVAVGPTYAATLLPTQGGSRRWWAGGSFKLVLPGSAFPETCAYLFRLHAYKRVFNGCGPIEWFHSNDAEFSITIKKT